MLFIQPASNNKTDLDGLAAIRAISAIINHKYSGEDLRANFKFILLPADSMFQPNVLMRFGFANQATKERV